MTSRDNNRNSLTKIFDAERMYQQLGYKREFNQTNFLCVIVPTLQYEAFDSAGEKVLPTSIMKLLSSTQITHVFPFDNGKEPTGYMAYIEVDIDRSFYRSDTPKFPLWIDCRWRYAKRTSTSCVYTIRHPSRTQPYVKAEYVGINVDPVTRKPSPIPESWKIKFGIPSEGRRSEHVIPERNGSTVTMVTEHKVSYNDVDANGHATFSFYGHISFASFAENLFIGRLENEAERYFNNGIKKLQTTFFREVLMGDILKVESWKDNHSNDTYYFEIRRNDQLCSRLTFIFHEESPDSLSSKL